MLEAYFSKLKKKSVKNKNHRQIQNGIVIYSIYFLGGVMVFIFYRFFYALVKYASILNLQKIM